MTTIAAPRAGRSVEGLVAPLRDAMHAALAVALQVELPSIERAIQAASADDDELGDFRERAAWALIAATVVHWVAGFRDPNPTDAARRFGWSDVALTEATANAIAGALAPLAPHAQSNDLRELLPYLLDTFGRTGRLEVMRDSGKADQRAARKAAGSFYTPADLADFMVGAIAPPPDTPFSRYGTWFDPAAGSGVFLAAALRRERKRGTSERLTIVTEHMAGCDLSPQACDFAAFALLGELVSGDAFPQLGSLWAAVRRNFVATDAIVLASTPAKLAELRRKSLAHGPVRLVCNPPYAAEGNRVPLVAGGDTRSVYLPFIEMAWTIADGAADEASLVVPLALAANRSSDHRRVRTAITNAGGDWTFLFFDRQPHALFGEDAKIRATIAIKRAGPLPASVRTSGLLKWTSRQRVGILNEHRAVSMENLSIGRLIPKLANRAEADLYEALTAYSLPTGAKPALGTAAADEIVGSVLSDDVFVGGTAYNFVNVFRNYPDRLSWRGQLSASGIHRLRCRNGEDADATLALLASRCAFWLWHVECDGFHVPAWFLAELPLLNIPFAASTRSSLAELGRMAWEGLQGDVVCSDNRGRLTFAFRPTGIAEIRDAVDEILVEAVGAKSASALALREFEQRTVSIDGSVRLATTSGKAKARK